MNTYSNNDADFYWLAWDASAYHCGGPGRGQVQTGLANLEHFATLEALNARLATLGKPPYTPPA